MSAWTRTAPRVGDVARLTRTVDGGVVALEATAVCSTLPLLGDSPRQG